MCLTIKGVITKDSEFVMFSEARPPYFRTGGNMAAAAATMVTFPTTGGLRAVPRRIRVLTVDGQQLVQEGLAAMINREDDMTVVASASSAEEAMDDVRRYKPDVVTLDLLLPDMA